MSKFRTTAIAAAAGLILVHGAVLLLRYGTDDGIALGRLDRHRRATGRQPWSAGWRRARPGPLESVSGAWSLSPLLITAIGQGSLHRLLRLSARASRHLWPSDVLVFFWVVPAAMTLFLSPRDPGSGYAWLRVCDFVQVCTLALAVELSQIYVPSRWQAGWPGDAGSHAARRDLFLRLDRLEFPAFEAC